MIELDLEVMEFTDLPEGLKGLLKQLEIAPDFLGTMEVGLLDVIVVHGHEEDRCYMLAFTEMHGFFWQMHETDTNSKRLFAALSHVIHAELNL